MPWDVCTLYLSARVSVLLLIPASCQCASLSPCHPHGSPGLSSGFLALASPNPSFCSHLGSESVGGIPVVSISMSLYISLINLVELLLLTPLAHPVCRSVRFFFRSPFCPHLIVFMRLSMEAPKLQDADWSQEKPITGLQGIFSFTLSPSGE